MRIFQLFPLLEFVFFKPSQIRLPQTFSPGTEWINFHNLDAFFMAKKKKKKKKDYKIFDAFFLAKKKKEKKITKKFHANF